MILRSSLSIRGLYYADNTIFAGFSLPTGVSLDTIRTQILAECGELEILYPDPDYFKAILTSWSSMRLPVWNRIKEMLDNVEYDPTMNYSKVTEHEGSGTSDTTSTDSVKGYNETSFVDSAKNVTNNEQTDEFTRTVKGNIGIQSMSKLIQEEIEMRESFNLPEIIIEEFKRRFCILVY